MHSLWLELSAAEAWHSPVEKVICLAVILTPLIRKFIKELDGKCKASVPLKSPNPILKT